MTTPFIPGWMQTFSGQKFPLHEIDPAKLLIEDIAHALAFQCRYGGHAKIFYPVAYHCVLASQVAPEGFEYTTLMHDASEAYLVDIPRPIKKLLPGYYEIENMLMAKIAEKFEFSWPLPPEVTYIDNAILSDEHEQVVSPMPGITAAEWGAPHPKLGVNIVEVSPRQAEQMFLDRFFEIAPPQVAAAARASCPIKEFLQAS